MPRTSSSRHVRSGGFTAAAAGHITVDETATVRRAFEASAASYIQQVSVA